MWELTVQFENYGDMLNAMKTIRNKDVNRKSLVDGFRGEVMVVIDDYLSRLHALSEIDRRSE